MLFIILSTISRQFLSTNLEIEFFEKNTFDFRLFRLNPIVWVVNFFTL